MERAELVEKVKTIINREVEIPADELRPDSRLGDFEIDSLDIIKLALAFENEFKIEIAPAELGQVETLNDVINELERKINPVQEREATALREGT